MCILGVPRVHLAGIGPSAPMNVVTLRVHVPNNWLLRVLVILIMVQLLVNS